MEIIIIASAFIGFILADHYRKNKKADLEFKEAQESRVAESVYMQEYEDEKFKQAIESEAFRLSLQHKSSLRFKETFGFEQFYAFNPVIPVYHIYNCDVAKYNSSDADKIFNEKYNQLIAEA